MSALIATHIFSLSGVSVAMGTQGTFVRISPSTEVCSFTETRLTSTCIYSVTPLSINYGFDVNRKHFLKLCGDLGTLILL